MHFLQYDYLVHLRYDYIVHNMAMVSTLRAASESKVQSPKSKAYELHRGLNIIGLVKEKNSIHCVNVVTNTTSESEQRQTRKAVFPVRGPHGLSFSSLDGPPSQDSYYIHGSKFNDPPRRLFERSLKCGLHTTGHLIYFVVRVVCLLPSSLSRLRQLVGLWGFALVPMAGPADQ